MPVQIVVENVEKDNDENREIERVNAEKLLPKPFYGKAAYTN